MRLRTLFVIACAVMMLSFGATGASPPDCYTTSEPEVDTGSTPGGHYYVDADAAVWIEDWLLPYVWVYEETNGIVGLQRDDEHRIDVAACGPESGVVGDRLVVR